MKKPLLNLTIQSSELKMLTSISIRLRLYIKICKIGLNMNCPNMTTPALTTSTIQPVKPLNLVCQFTEQTQQVRRKAANFQMRSR
jgi:hypothetical protein